MSAIVYTGTPTVTQNLVPTPALTTLERLLLWCLLLFDFLNSMKDVNLLAGDTVKQVSYQRFKGKDGLLYLGFTVFVPVADDFDISLARPWTLAIELNNAKGSDLFNA